MFEFLKNLATENEWHFEYGRQDYQNLAQLSGDTVGLFVDPIVIDSRFSDSGNESQSFSGKLMFLINSDVDDFYQEKYVEIKTKISNELQKLKDGLACSEYQINSFRTMEVINLFDQNYDGWLVNYNVTLID